MKEKIKKILILVIVIIGFIIVFNYIKLEKEPKEFCEEFCLFLPDKIWEYEYDNRFFETKEQCMGYCVKEVKKYGGKEAYVNFLSAREKVKTEIIWEEQRVAEEQRIECKKRVVKTVLDPNMYIKDLNSLGLGEKRNQIIDIIAFLTERETFEIENLANDEWHRLANKAGWEEMSPLRIKDVIGEIDLDSIDYTNPNLLSSYCH